MSQQEVNNLSMSDYDDKSPNYTDQQIVFAKNNTTQILRNLWFHLCNFGYDISTDKLRSMCDLVKSDIYNAELEKISTMHDKITSNPYMQHQSEISTPTQEPHHHNHQIDEYDVSKSDHNNGQQKSNSDDSESPLTTNESDGSNSWKTVVMKYPSSQLQTTNAVQVQSPIQNNEICLKLRISNKYIQRKSGETIVTRVGTIPYNKNILRNLKNGYEIVDEETKSTKSYSFRVFFDYTKTKNVITYIDSIDTDTITFTYFKNPGDNSSTEDMDKKIISIYEEFLPHLKNAIAYQKYISERLPTNIDQTVIFS